MFNGIKVIDADGHVMEPNELYDQYLDPKFRADLEELKQVAATRAARYFFGFFHQLNTGRPLGIVDLEKPLVRSGRRPHGETPDPRGGFDPHVRIKDMDREGIDIAVLFATVVSSFCALKSIDFEVAMIRAYHRWIADYCAAYPNRLKAVAILPMRAPERAVEELHRVAKEPWVVGAYLSAHVEDKLLDHPAFHSIWQALVDEDLPACFHGGTARPPYGLGTFEMGNNLFLQHSATNPFEVMRGIAAFIGGGVLEIFPKLRAAFLEAGVGWLPFWMERLDEHHELMPEYTPFLHRKPSEAIRSENFFISCDPDEATLPYVVSVVGAEHILYASDYPHFDGRFPHTVSLTAGRAEFPPAVQRKILHENPTRLYPRLKWMKAGASIIAVIAFAMMIGGIAAAQSDDLNPDANQVAVVRKRHLAELMKIPHVVGVATELSNDGEIVLDVEVDKPENVSDVEREAPSQVDGFPVDVDVVERAEASPNFATFSSSRSPDESH